MILANLWLAKQCLNWLDGDLRSGCWYRIFNQYIGWAMDNPSGVVTRINETH